MKKNDDASKIYGQFVIDFANAKTTDEAGIIFLHDLRETFFRDESRFPRLTPDDKGEGFPTLAGFKSRFNPAQLTLLDLYGQSGETEEQVRALFNSYRFQFKFYDSKNDSLIFREYWIHTDTSGDEPRGELEYLGDVGIPLEKIEEEYEELSEMQITPERVDRLHSYRNALRNLHSKLNVLESSIDPTRVEEVRDIADYYHGELLKEHRFIQDLKAKLCNCLDQIVQNKKIVIEDEAEDTFAIFLNAYNRMPRPKTRIGSAGEIVTVPQFEAESFLTRTEVSRHLEKYYTEPIAYCLIEFLRNPDNRIRLKKCTQCSGFIIRKRRFKERKHDFCSTKCRLSWHNAKRIKSGQHREYKKKKREEGAKPSYYG
jgi:hypothetical protein